MYKNAVAPFTSEIWRPPVAQMELHNHDSPPSARFSAYPPVMIRDPAATAATGGASLNAKTTTLSMPPVSPPGYNNLSFSSRLGELRSPDSESMSPPNFRGNNNTNNNGNANKPPERQAMEYVQSLLRGGLPMNLASLKTNWSPFQLHCGSIEEFLLGHPQFFKVDWGNTDDVTMVRRVVNNNTNDFGPSSASSFIQPPRRLHNKILTLLSLSPTYSYDVEMLRHEIGWEEPKQGSFQQYLVSTMKQDGKQLFTLSMSNGRCRVHLIKDIYLNAVSQKLRALYEKHYKTSSELLTVEMMRRFLYWDCPTRQFKDFLLSHGLGKLLTPPSRSGSGTPVPPVPIAAPVEAPPVACISAATASAAGTESARPVRPQIIRSVNHLVSVMSFVKQQYNLVSVVCYAGKTPQKGLPMMSLIRLTQANKQVILVDLVALSEEAQHQWLGPGEDFDLKRASFVNELRSLMSSEEIRKCVWNFKPYSHLLQDDFGIKVNGLIDMFPIVNYFFPEFIKEAGEMDDGFPCPRLIAEKLAPQIWKSSDFVPVPQVYDWHHRPLTTDMVNRASCIGVGALLDIRKGARTELSTRVNEKMTKVSEMYYTTGELANATTTLTPDHRTPELSALLAADLSSSSSSSMSPGVADDSHWLFSSPGILRGFDQGFEPFFTEPPEENDILTSAMDPSKEYQMLPSPPRLNPSDAEDEINPNPIDASGSKWNQAMQIFSQLSLSVDAPILAKNPMTTTINSSEFGSTMGPVGSSFLEDAPIATTASGSAEVAGAFFSPSSRPTSPVISRPSEACATRSPPIGGTPTSPFGADSFARTLSTGFDSGFVLAKGLNK